MTPCAQIFVGLLVSIKTEIQQNDLYRHSLSGSRVDTETCARTRAHAHARSLSLQGPRLSLDLSLYASLSGYDNILIYDYICLNLYMRVRVHAHTCVRVCMHVCMCCWKLNPIGVPSPLYFPPFFLSISFFLFTFMLVSNRPQLAR